MFSRIRLNRWRGQSLGEFLNLRDRFGAIAMHLAAQCGLAVLCGRPERNQRVPTGWLCETLIVNDSAETP